MGGQQEEGTREKLYSEVVEADVISDTGVSAASADLPTIEETGRQPEAVAPDVEEPAEVAAEVQRPAGINFDRLDDPDFDFDDVEVMSQIYEETVRNFASGEVVRARVVDVGRDRVLVDIQYKSEGAVLLNEFVPGEEMRVGDEFDVFIEEPEGEDGMPVLSKIKADRIKNWTHIQRVYETDGVLDGKITRRVKGGFKADIGLDAFLPASQVSLRPTGDLDQFVGESLEFKIIKLTRRRRNVVVSHRKYLEDLQAERKKRLLETLEEGKILSGEVKNVTDFGAFVDVGGIDGLLHVTDMSWGRVKHPSNVVRVGDEIEVMVLRFDPSTERISLGLKQKSENPWLTVDQRYEIASIVAGRVVSMTDYGAFVELEPGVEGMVHVSEMSWTRRIRHPSDVLDLDQDVDVMVLGMDKQNQKIALGFKQTKPNPWFELEDKFPIGTIVEGEVRNLTDYGAFIQVNDDIDGLLHVSDMSWTRKVSHPSELLEKGRQVRVRILSIDPEHEKVSLGLKQLDIDPWSDLPEKYNVGDHIEVVISKLVSFGAFATLDCGVEGLIHVSELSRERVSKPEDVVSVDDKVTVKVIAVDSHERKIGLSIKEFQHDIEEEVKSKYGGSAPSGIVSVGEIVGEAVPPSFLEEGLSLVEAANKMMQEDRAERRMSGEQKAATEVAEAMQPADVEQPVQIETEPQPEMEQIVQPEPEAQPEPEQPAQAVEAEPEPEIEQPVEAETEPQPEIEQPTQAVEAEAQPGPEPAPQPDAAVELAGGTPEAGDIEHESSSEKHDSDGD